jgi:hypothetical protein
MSLEDRLLEHRESLRDKTEDPIELWELQADIISFAGLLLQSDKIKPELREKIRSVQRGASVPIRLAFQAAFEKEHLKAAYFLIGVYEAVFQ